MHNLRRLFFLTLRNTLSLIFVDFFLDILETDFYYQITLLSGKSCLGHIENASEFLVK